MAEISLSEFADKITQIMPLIMREIARQEVDELYKGKITLQQFLTLSYLYKEGESKMSGLATFLNITTAAMTGIADRLVRANYIERKGDPQDRRIVIVGLTTKGKNLVEKISEQKRKMLIRIFGKLSERDRSDYLRILMQIKEILTKENT